MAVHLTLTISSNENGGRRWCRWKRWGGLCNTRHLAAGLASIEKAIGERAQGSQWLLNSVFLSGKTQLKSKNGLLPHPGMQRVKGSLLWGFYCNGLPHPMPGSWRSCYILKLGKVERWHWAGLFMSGKPCSNYMFLQPRNSRPGSQQGESCIVEREWENGKKSVWGDEVSMTVYNLCCSLQTYNQGQHRSGTITGFPRPKGFYHQTPLMAALLQGGASLPWVVILSP